MLRSCAGGVRRGSGVGALQDPSTFCLLREVRAHGFGHCQAPFALGERVWLLTLFGEPKGREDREKRC